MRRLLLPFHTTYYINAHHYIVGELKRQGVRFRKDDNAFLWVSEVEALQAAADRLSPEVIGKRPDNWTLVVDGGTVFVGELRAQHQRPGWLCRSHTAAPEFPASRSRTPG